jgi:hypothetical protein
MAALQNITIVVSLVATVLLIHLIIRGEDQ